MVRQRLLPGLMIAAAMLAAMSARADDNPGREMLDKATEVKLSAENANDLNEVITLCQDALRAGLDESNTKFANELLASTLTQRAELICNELFERPVRPNRAGKLVEMALSDLEATIKVNPQQSLAQYLLGRLYCASATERKGHGRLERGRASLGRRPAAARPGVDHPCQFANRRSRRLADFDAAVKLTPGNPDVFRFRGMYQLSENRAEQALADFQKAIELDPEDADTHEACGLAQSILLKYDDAMESFNKAVELAPENSMAYTHRARVRH